MNRPHLTKLAERAGILPEYHEISGRLHVTSEQTYVDLLRAMGCEASTEEQARATLEALERRDRERLFEPTRVLTPARAAFDAFRATGRIPDDVPRFTVEARAPERLGDAGEWRLEVTLEDGAVHVADGRFALHGEARRLQVSLPCHLPPGYHSLSLELSGAGERVAQRQTLIAAPPTCLTWREALDGRRAFGLWTHLYSLRGDGPGHGIGSFTDLEDLLRLAAARGADFVGINPLHALSNQTGKVSPYSPVSRLFHNPIYLDLQVVPEFIALERETPGLIDEETHRVFQRFEDSSSIDYEGVWRTKRRVLRRLYQVFKTAPRERRGAYEEYVARQGRPLEDFAAFCALATLLDDAVSLENTASGGQEASQPDEAGRFRAWLESVAKVEWEEVRGWSRCSWPAPLRDPKSDALDRFRTDFADEVDFQRYLQFEVDRQLRRVHDAGRAAGMKVGLYLDVAIGSAGDGSDPWSYATLFAMQAKLGAPPDMHSEEGQDWGFPPLNPLRLKEEGYRYWIDLLERVFARAGMIRLDHVLGLFRQFWIPQGKKALEGAYVRFPAEELLAIVALQSRRQGVVVVGEDLGTVPPDVPEHLRRWGILSTRVLYYEREHDVGFKPARAYHGNALVVADTHDNASLSSFWEGYDLTLRRELGWIKTDEALAQARVFRGRERAALLARLIEEGLLTPEAWTGLDHARLCRAVYLFLLKTAAPLVGVSLDDVAGEKEPVNLPGVPESEHPNWTRRMARRLSAIGASPDATGLFDALREAVGKV